MFDHSPNFAALPCASGVGYKPEHFKDLLRDPSPVEDLEIHAESCMGDDSPTSCINTANCVASWRSYAGGWAVYRQRRNIGYNASAALKIPV